VKFRAQHLDARFAALAHPVRRAIIIRLTAGPATLTELARPFELTVQAVAKHITMLERAGLVVRAREAQRRPVRLVASAFAEPAVWLAHLSWSARPDCAGTMVCRDGRIRHFRELERFVNLIG
jgi:DNA-binding transcriptional ArsR family regulator